MGISKQFSINLPLLSDHCETAWTEMELYERSTLEKMMSSVAGSVNRKQQTNPVQASEYVHT